MVAGIVRQKQLPCNWVRRASGKARAMPWTCVVIPEMESSRLWNPNAAAPTCRATRLSTNMRGSHCQIVILLGVPTDAPGSQLVDQISRLAGLENLPRQEISDLHDSLLSALGITQQAIPRHGPNWLEQPAVREFQQKLGALLSAEAQPRPAMLIHDPRIASLLPAWLPVLEQTGCKPLALFFVQHPGDFAASAVRRPVISREKAILLWLDAHLTAERDSRGIDRIAFDYRQSLQHPEAAADKLIALLGRPPATVENSHGTIEPGLPAGVAPMKVPELAQRAFTALKEMETAEGQRELDAIRGEWEAASALFAAELASAELRAADLEKSYQIQVNVSVETMEKLNQKQAELRQRKAKLEEAKRRISEMEGSLSWKLTKPFRRAFGKRKATPAKPATAAKERPKPKSVDPAKLAFPVIESPAISIIIPVYNQLAYTLSCLDALMACGESPAFEVVIVDDGSTDDSQKVLGSIPGVRYCRNEPNMGFVASCNRGADASTGAYLLFLNNDTRVEPGILRALIDTFQQHPGAGLVGAKLIYPDGRLQEAGGAVYRSGDAANLGKGGDPNDPDFCYLREVDYCSGACIMIPRDLFFELDRFDTRFSPCYYEDTDLAFKVHEAGRKVFFQPLARVEHFEGVTCGTDILTGPKKHQEKNRSVFYQKWAARLANQPAKNGEVLPGNAPRRILVINNRMPSPDRDSGSVRLVRILELMVHAGHHVTFLPDDREAPEGYTRDLQSHGVRVLHAPFIDDTDAFLRKNAPQFAVALLVGPGIAWKYLRPIRSTSPSTRIIYDTVDLRFVRERRQADLLNDDTARKEAEEWHAKEIMMAASADTTWVVSAAEESLLRAEAPAAKVEIVSNIHEIHGSATPFAARRDILFIGGFRHLPNLDAIRFFVGEVWPAVSSAIPDVKFHVIGECPPEEIQALASERIIICGYQPDIKPYFETARLSVAPLRFGAGVKGKINLSMSYGVPVVATALAVEGMGLTPGNDILVAGTPAQFAQSVIQLYNDETLWNRLSTTGLATTQKIYSAAPAKEIIEKL